MFLNFRQSGFTINTGLIFLPKKGLLFFIYHINSVCASVCVCVCVCVCARFHLIFLPS